MVGVWALRTIWAEVVAPHNLRHLYAFQERRTVKITREQLTGPPMGEIVYTWAGLIVNLDVWGGLNRELTGSLLIQGAQEEIKQRGMCKGYLNTNPLDLKSEKPLVEFYLKEGFVLRGDCSLWKPLK